MRLKTGKVVSERERMQAKIIEGYGDEIVRQKEIELCQNCERDACLLLPITSKGEDCPYFERMVNSG